MSHLLELLGRGLGDGVGDALDRYFWSPQARSIEELEASCREHPDWADLRLQLGLARLRSAQLDEAIRHLSHACRCKPDFLAARLALASAHEEKGDLAKALEHLGIASQNSPGEPPILFAAGFCHEKLQQPQAAAERYRDAIARDPSLWAARERLAAVDVLLNNLPEAIEQYQALCQARPGESWLRGAIAHLYLRDGRYDQAVAEFESAIAMEPENWSFVDDEVEALVAGGQLREAVERLHMLLEEQGPFADLHCRLADLYSQSGNDPAATKNYLLALETQPDYLEALVKLGTHHLVNGRWEQAAESFHRAAEINDRLLVCYAGMGVAQAAAGRKTEAMNSFDLAGAVEPNSTVLLAEVAKLQLKAAAAESFNRDFEPNFSTPVSMEVDHDELLARQLHRHAEQVEMHPEHADLRYRYGVLLRSEGRLGEAVEQFTKAVEINPAYIKAIIRLGITQQELGMTEEAIETFKKALLLRPGFVDLHYRMGLLYTDRRQFEDAVRHMEAASGGAPGNERIRSGLAISLQNMGLMDEAAAAWRSLWKVHNAAADKRPKQGA